MSRAWNPQTDDLSDDDDEAIRQLSGGLYDGDEVRRRMAKAPRWKRNCPPSYLRDRELTWKFYLACLEHEAEANRMSEHDEGALERVIEMVKQGKIKTVEDIPDDFIVQGMVTLATGSRRPTVQMKALEKLAEMKGIAKPQGAAADRDQLQDMLDRALAPRGPRALSADEDGPAGARAVPPGA